VNEQRKEKWVEIRSEERRRRIVTRKKEDEEDRGSATKNRLTFITGKCATLLLRL
jgi:hypothetical protein